MALKDLRIIQTEDQELSRIQDSTKNYLSQLNRFTLSGNFLEKIGPPDNLQEITIGTSTTLVPHGLGRKFVGWHLLDLQGDSRVWRDPSSTADLSLYLPLKASSAVKVKLWVF